MIPARNCSGGQGPANRHIKLTAAVQRGYAGAFWASVVSQAALGQFPQRQLMWVVGRHTVF